ncbi:carboxymuconolactone decarboxylase family protein [Rhodococcus sp. NPDC003318]|uniref:carboxymuconolactone decarboxylase family protein n=1 Tax=Rhodococcus sp. NPDC003318 TaxID=3364503 RepID=UPI0036C537A8
MSNTTDLAPNTTDPVDIDSPDHPQPGNTIRDRLIRIAGELDESWESTLAIDDDFVGAYVDLAEVPENKAHLDPKSRALIALAVSASVTTLDPAGVRTAATAAARAGATREEALEAVHLVSVLGVHCMVTGIPELSAVAAAHGTQVVSDAPLDAEQERIRDEFRARRGYWSAMNETLLRVDATWFEAYTRYSSHPWVNGSLTPKLRELIYIAIDLSPTHLFTAGVRPHIENALRYGATVDEIVETLEVTALVGIASLRSAAPTIAEVFG